MTGTRTNEWLADSNFTVFNINALSPNKQDHSLSAKEIAYTFWQAGRASKTSVMLHTLKGSFARGAITFVGKGAIGVIKKFITPGEETSEVYGVIVEGAAMHMLRALVTDISTVPLKTCLGAVNALSYHYVAQATNFTFPAIAIETADKTFEWLLKFGSAVEPIPLPSQKELLGVIESGARVSTIISLCKGFDYLLDENNYDGWIPKARITTIHEGVGITLDIAVLTAVAAAHPLFFIASTALIGAVYSGLKVMDFLYEKYSHEDAIKVAENKVVENVSSSESSMDTYAVQFMGHLPNVSDEL